MARPEIRDIQAAMEDRAHPSVTLWNRLEGRPRTINFERALRAEVRDALWFLTRQWQAGELRGDDAGTPVLAKIHLETTRLDRYQAAGGGVEALTDQVPLEARVERRPIPMVQAGRPVALDIRLLMGRQWIKLVSRVGNYAAEYIRAYPIEHPDPHHREDGVYCAHPQVWAAMTAVAGRRMDGARLYDYLTGDPTRHAYDGLSVLETHKSAIDKLAKKFIDWFEALFLQPADSRNDAWVPERAEYQFAVSAPGKGGETAYSAEEYYQGQLDWYSLDADPTHMSLRATSGAATVTSETRTLIPVPVRFRGMPDSRWWAFEDGRTNFGDVKPGTTDIALLLLVEFGLVYANDWSIVPFTVPSGSIVQLKGLVVTNVFGERIWITAAGSEQEEVRHRWRMFVSEGAGAVPASETASRLLLLPTAAKMQAGPVLEEAGLARDEMANTVWGIEKTICLATGEGRPGGEAATEFVAFHQRLVSSQQGSVGSPGSPPAKASIRYEVMNNPPENWIPFIPVHVPGDIRQTQLQRARMPRLLPGGPPGSAASVEPRTSLLRVGLDQAAPFAYFLHEEEVPRVGVRLVQSFRRTRGLDGRAVVWLGINKETGRSEGSSGLAFDQLSHVQVVADAG
jgi:hypothetical protein